MADQACNLPLDIWAQILRHAQPSIAKAHDQHWHSVTHKEQTIFWHLPLVCKAFHTVFTAHPELGCAVVLAKGPLKPWIPCSKFATSFKPWLTCHADAIQTIDFGPHTVHIADYLAALSLPATILTAIKLQVLHNTRDIQSLACFTSLVSCSLSKKTPKFSTWEVLNLASLSELPHLVHLNLSHGAFNDLSAAKFLTHLEISWADVYVSDCSSLSMTLLKMDLKSCRMTFVDSQSTGLVLFTALQSLHMGGHCYLETPSDDDYDFTMDDIIRIPIDLSPLASLTSLKLQPTGRGEWFVHRRADSSGIGSLPNLQHLSIEATGALDFGSAYQSLSRVSSLCIRVKDFASAPRVQNCNDISPDPIGLASFPGL